MKSLKRIFVVVVAVILVISMTSCSMLVNVVMDFFDKDEVVFDNGIVSVDDKMMGFFLNDHIIDWYNQYGAYMAYFSLDFNKDLKDQVFGDNSNGYAYEIYFLDASFEGTWYDYFMEPVRVEVETYIAYASAAKTNGISLTPEQEIKIENVIHSLNEALNKNGYDYSDWYGRGVDEDVVRRCYELKFLAANFYDVLNDNIIKTITEDQIVEYRENNKELFYEANCLTYTIQVNHDKMSDEEYENACNAAISAAEAIANSESSESFVYNIIKYENERDGISDYEICLDLTVDDYLSTFKYGEDDGELGEFLFGEMPAEKGDTTIIKVEKGTDGRYVFAVTVYFVFDPMYYNNEPTHDFAYVISDDMHHITDIKSEFEASADKSLDTFINIASKIEASGEHDVFEYASMEKTESGWFELAGGTDYKKIDNWLDSADRYEGDLSDVFTLEVKSTHDHGKETTSVQYALVYFDEHNESAWYVKAKEGVFYEQGEAWFENYIWEIPITMTEEINEINTIKILSSLGGFVGGGNITVNPGGTVTVNPNESGNDSFAVITPIPDGGIVIAPGQGNTDDDSEKFEETESEKKVDIVYKENTTIYDKFELSDSIIKFETVDVVISVNSSSREICYVSQYGLTIYYPAIPNFYL